MMNQSGFEKPFNRNKNSPKRAANNLERVMGIEPTLFAWEARVLPLNDTRMWESLLEIKSSARGDADPFTRLHAAYTDQSAS